VRGFLHTPKRRGAYVTRLCTVLNALQPLSRLGDTVYVRALGKLTVGWDERHIHREVHFSA